MTEGEPTSKALPATHAQARRLAGRHWFALGCLGVLALSFVLSPEHPTGGFEICLMKRLSGRPCPGCGITRAVIWCSRGEFARSFHQHPLGPPMWLAAIVGAMSLVWPKRLRDAAASFYRRRERGITLAVYVLTAALLVFGAARIVFALASAPSWWPW